jgi:predicted lipoprotein with Yx(FWY)xxD motif
MQQSTRIRREPRRRRGALGLTALGLLAVGLAAVGIWSAGALAGGTSTSKGTVSLRSTALGKVLVSAKGRTLYLFLKDRNGKSACAGMCAQYWPPLLAKGKPSAGSGVKAALLATTRRADGKLQVTYRRHPLYLFALDKRAGQTAGEGMSAFGGKWYVVSASGAAVKRAAPAGTTSTTTTTTPYPNPYP